MGDAGSAEVSLAAYNVSGGVELGERIGGCAAPREDKARRPVLSRTPRQIKETE